MNIVIAPDKFKGSLTSFELCAAINKGVLATLPTATITCLPMADGGDGFSAVMAHYIHAETVTCRAVDAIGRPITACYQYSGALKTAILEIAAASGIAGLQNEEKNPLLTSSFGTGILMLDAIAKGAETIVLGLGGSATNDGGTGILNALGFKFFDKAGNILHANGAALQHIHRMEHPATTTTTRMVLACDVGNPMTGPNGATYTYAAQKGASPAAIEQLEGGMLHFADLLENITGKPLKTIPGLGAAGAAGAGLMLLENVSIESGLTLVLKASNAAQHIQTADLVITGEGSFDAQTLNGKVVFGVAQLANEMGKQVIAICGSANASSETIKACGLDYITSICKEPVSLEYSLANAASLTTSTASRAMDWVAKQ